MTRATDWQLVSDDGSVRTYHQYTDLGDGRTAVTIRQEWHSHEAYLKQAADERSANAGKRWGDGKIIGRLPMSLYFSSGMAEARKQGDEAWVKRFWNDSSHKYLRTFEGQV